MFRRFTEEGVEVDDVYARAEQGLLGSQVADGGERNAVNRMVVDARRNGTH